MRYLSLCSGIEAATVAWGPLGWQAVAFAEIDKFPAALLAYRYPDVPNLGDMRGINGADFRGKVDVLVGGTPCQSFSVAGLRRGLEDERGNLALEFVRIADEIDPTFVVWENVPGVLSDRGNAFGCFLGALAGEVSQLEPPGGRWANAGYVLGPCRAIAWRILDAQYFGLAQRRKRVFLVACPRNGADPRTILFEYGGLRRDSAPGREAGAKATGRIEQGSLECCYDARGNGDGKTVNTISGDHESRPTDYTTCVVTQALTGRMGEGAPDDNKAQGGFYVTTWPAEIAPTLNAHYGDKQGLEDQHVNQGCPLFVPGEIESSLRAEGFDASEDGTGRQNLIVTPLQEVGKRTGVSTDDPRAGIGIGSPGDPMFTLQSGAQHAVASIAIRGREGGASVEMRTDGTANALRASEGGRHGEGYGAVLHLSAVRRLTPRECERLQGFPDNYTLIPYRGKPAADCADGPRYKALGNSMAIPVIRWIGERIDEANKRL